MAELRLLAVDHGFCFSSGVFSSFDGCVGSFACSFAGRVSSFTSSVDSFFASSGRVFGDRLCVGSHGVAGFAHRVSGFTASGEAQSRGSNSSCKNDLTHNFNSLFNE